jgi:hypothetical protein
MRFRALAASVPLFLLGGTVAAQEETTAERVLRRFDDLVRATIASRTDPTARIPAGRVQQLNEQRNQAASTSSVSAAADAVEPDDSTAAATVRRLAGAIRLNPDGTEAGIVVAPFLLAGSCSLKGLELTLASLEGDRTRFGASYTVARAPQLDEKDVAAIPRCDVAASIADSVEEARRFFVPACVKVVALFAQKPEPDRTKEETRALGVCGLANQPARRLSEAVTTVAAAVIEAAGGTSGATTIAALEMQPLAASIQSSWKLPTPYSCHTATEEGLYLQRLFWSKAKTKFAASLISDHFPRRFGFSPDGSSLPHGERNAWELRADFSRAKGAFEWALGAGLAGSREGPDDGWSQTLTPSLALAQAFTLLSGKPLQKDGVLNSDDGGLPPHLVLGLAAKAEIALDRPHNQTSSFNSIRIQPYLDFLISDTLSFRLGVPIKGVIAERPAKDDDAGQRSLQWTVPVSIVTVLKL